MLINIFKKILLNFKCNPYGENMLLISFFTIELLLSFVFFNFSLLIITNITIESSTINIQPKNNLITHDF